MQKIHTYNTVPSHEQLYYVCKRVNIRDEILLNGFFVKRKYSDYPCEGEHYFNIIVLPENPPTATVWIQLKAQPEV